MFNMTSLNWLVPEQITKTTPQFTVTTKNGFLPLEDPLYLLPECYEPLDSMLKRMPALLAIGKLGEAVDKELPILDVDDAKDSALLAALFRDYCFLASGYLLEPSDLTNRKIKVYSAGRPVLPKCIAVPLQKVADKLGLRPFMDYAHAYALYNYKRKDPAQPIELENLELVRSFTGIQSEAGFILVHVDMVRYSSALIENVIKGIQAVEAQDRIEFDMRMQDLLATMQLINRSMHQMWIRSKPADYDKFRTFILGTKNQPVLFPRGVIYEGVDQVPRYYRGESGANDSIVPTLDNFLELTEKMPHNKMTEILKDFRSYRPLNQQEWLTWVEKSANQVGVQKFCKASPGTLKLYIALLDQIREFRMRHWSFASQYIIKTTAYPMATGGSPMATWLPNQLRVVLTELEGACQELIALQQDSTEEKNIMRNAQKDMITLNNNVSRLLSRKVSTR